MNFIINTFIKFLSTPKKFSNYNKNNILKNLYRVGKFFCTTSLMYSKESCKKIYKLFLPIKWQIDWFYSNQKLIKVFCLGNSFNLKKYSPFWNSFLSSDIVHPPIKN